MGARDNPRIMSGDGRDGSTLRAVGMRAAPEVKREFAQAVVPSGKPASGSRATTRLPSTLRYFNRSKAPFRFPPIASASRPLRAVTVDGAVLDSRRCAGEALSAIMGGFRPVECASVTPQSKMCAGLNRCQLNRF